MNHRRRKPRRKLVTRLNLGGAGKGHMGIGIPAASVPAQPAEVRARIAEREQREE